MSAGLREDSLNLDHWAASRRVRRLAEFLLRAGLSSSLLSAVADRFGLWGRPGTPQVAWGTFNNFLAYTKTLNPWCPQALVPTLGWSATLAELGLGIALLIGFRLRWTALLTALLMGAFALAMTSVAGVHAPLNYSVFVCATASFFLAVMSENVTTNPSAIFDAMILYHFSSFLKNISLKSGASSTTTCTYCSNNPSSETRGISFFKDEPTNSFPGL